MAKHTWAEIGTWLDSNEWTYITNEDADGVISYSIYDPEDTEIATIPNANHPGNDSGVSGFTLDLVKDVMVYEASHRWENGDLVGAIQILSCVSGDMISEK